MSNWDILFAKFMLGLFVLVALCLVGMRLTS